MICCYICEHMFLYHTKAMIDVEYYVVTLREDV